MDIDISKLPKEITDKYQITDNTFFATPKTDVKDLIQLEIGDSKVLDTFIPQVKIQRWDNECNVSIRLKDSEIGAEKVETKTDKIVWSKGNIEANFYDLNNTDHPEGASEFDITLKEKPLTNIVEFTLVDKDVDYFYQPALTPEEIAEGASRPENVVGSYAVYAKTPKTNWTGGKEYKVGKVGHIYRPKITDAVGDWVWGDLNIADGILSVTIPQDFLDKAVYPVRHAAGLTFGYTTVGGSDKYMQAVRAGLDEDASGNQLKPSVNGTVDSISYRNIYTVSSVQIKGALYEKNTANSYAYINTTGERTSVTANTWEVFTFSSPPTVLTTATYGYRIIMWGSNSSSIRLKYDADTTYYPGYYENVAYGAWPASLGVTGRSQGERYSIYATYTASGGGAVAGPVPTLAFLGVG